MKEQLINFETAKLAKEKGFNIPSKYSINKEAYENSSEWTGQDFTVEDMLEAKGNTGEEYFLRPTQSLLQKWLREVYNLHFELMPIFSKHPIIPNGWIVSKFGITSNMQNKNAGIVNETYEKALEEGLQKCLELL